jgi:hypothetical protein
MLHMVWQWLDPAARWAALYHRLRWRAMREPISRLLDPRPPLGSPTTLCMERAVRYACALVRFHFNYGDFVRWLGGEYTKRHRNWDEIFDILTTSRQRHPPKSLPPADFVQ